MFPSSSGSRRPASRPPRVVASPRHRGGARGTSRGAPRSARRSVFRRFINAPPPLPPSRPRAPSRGGSGGRGGRGGRGQPTPNSGRGGRGGRGQPTPTSSRDRPSPNRGVTNGPVSTSASTVGAGSRKGNIKVIVRIRPVMPSEYGPREVVVAVDDHLIQFDPLVDEAPFYFHGRLQEGGDIGKRKCRDKTFCFDQVFGPAHTNEDVYQNTINPIIDSLLSGCNCSVFAYGATGSGKTYTMLGSPGNPGLASLTASSIYDRITSMRNEYEPEIQVSYVEVYNEEVKDLLGGSRILEVREDARGDTIIPHLTHRRPNNAEHLLDMLSDGNALRTQCPTDFNAESSRSHAVFQINIMLRAVHTDTTVTTKTSKLVMVDLAGSEKGSATGFKGPGFKEGSSINKSLLALASCICALSKRNPHTPFRNSKLTRILKDSLGGKCKTIMVANVSPCERSYHETYNTLMYAESAKKIKFQVTEQVTSVEAAIGDYKRVFSEMKAGSDAKDVIIEELKAQLALCTCNVPKVDAETQYEEQSPPILPFQPIILENKENGSRKPNGRERKLYSINSAL